MDKKKIIDVKRDTHFNTKVNGETLRFTTTWGLFSPRKIDSGTELLLKSIKPGQRDLSLDLGCGYGAIGLFVAKMTPKGLVHMVDKDFVAIDFAKKNSQVNNITNTKIYLSNGFDQVPNIKFDNVISNIPAKVGKELLWIFLEDAKKHLAKNGKIYIVTISGLKEFIKRNLRQVFGNYTKLAQLKGYTVSVAIKK